MGSCCQPRRSGCDPPSTVGIASAGSAPDPLRADGHVALHLLSGCRGGDGRRPRRDPRPLDSSCRPAATPTSRTSAASPPPTVAWYSGRMTSTRRFPGRGSGTSSGWRRASRSPVATSTYLPSVVGGSSQRAVREYREGMREFAGESMLDAWYERLDADELTARFGTKLDADEPGSCSTEPSTRGGERPARAAMRKLTEVDRWTARALSSVAAAADPACASCTTALPPTSVRPTCGSCSISTIGEPTR